MSNNKINPPYILVGSGGHAKVILSLLLAKGVNILGVCDPGLVKSNASSWRGLNVLGDDDVIMNYNQSDIRIANGVGFSGFGNRRMEIYTFLSQKGYIFPSLVHPFSFVDDSAVLKNGVQVMAGCIIQADVLIGENTVVNTRASIDHDVIIGASTHIAPSATICGGVRIGDGCYIGAASVVVQAVSIESNRFIKASALIKN